MFTLLKKTRPEGGVFKVVNDAGTLEALEMYVASQI